MPISGLRIFMTGMIATTPGLGGLSWVVLQYLLGLRRLGHEVVFVEPVPPGALRPEGARLEASKNASYFRRVVARFGLGGQAALLLEGTRTTCGLDFDELRAKAEAADLLLNVAGMLTEPALYEDIPRRAYLDLDPGFLQNWATMPGVDMRMVGHTHYVTVGLEVDRPGCPVPTCGRQWIATLPPVVLAEWPRAEGPPRRPWTTVAHWRGYGAFEAGGLFYGQKAHSLRALIDLPTRTDEGIDLALAIHPGEADDLRALRENGWGLLDPAEVAGDPDSFRDFVRWSRGEFGVAKLGYVNSRCGWFSDRSVCYLASGRPVLAQETGFSRHLPPSAGLFPFATADDVLGAIESVRTDYARCSLEARRLAEAVFDSDLVLGRLIDRLFET